MNQFTLSVAALIPALLLCWYIYAKDRMEKEPIGLLCILFFSGAAAYLPAIFAENLLIGAFDKVFENNMIADVGGTVMFESEGVYFAHSAFCSFFAVALVEEGIKWAIMFFVTFRNKNFSHLFDGVVYSVFVSLGFAAVENVRYAVIDGWNTFLLRSLISVPGHMMFGVLMGFFYTMWHTYLLCKKEERTLASEGRITVEKRFASAPWLISSIVLPIVIHGAYSFMRAGTSDAVTVIFYVFVIALYIVCFIGINRLSRADTEDDMIAHRIVLRKYPELKNTNVCECSKEDQ